MLNRIIGPMGSGKREIAFSLAERAYREGKQVFYLVPEQASAEVERALAKRLGAGFSTLVEVTNFSRISNVVLRSYGKIAVRSITEEEKNDRMARLLAAQRDITLAKNLPYVEKTVRVLVDDVAREGEGNYIGRTPGGKLVRFTDEKNRVGEFVFVKITKATPFDLFGEAVN